MILTTGILRNILKYELRKYKVFKCTRLAFIRKLNTMKIDTPEFRGIQSEGYNQLISLFNKHNYEIRIAGGAVRDILSGICPKDVDFATTALPEQMKEMFTQENVRMLNMRGEKHGTITARIGEENFEVTTLRIDKTTDGRHAEVEFTTDWKLDANRRDLTINSMFLHPDGTLCDYFNGYEDLKNKRIRFVGDTATRIQEDYLRILRYFRFYGRISELPDSHDESTLNAIKSNISGLAKISGERIWMELNKILSGKHVGYLVSRLVEVGAGPHLGFPENPNTTNFYEVWKQCHKYKPLPMTLLSALMSSEEDLLKTHARCKLSLFDKELGLFIIKYRTLTIHSEKDLHALYFNTEGKRSDVLKYIYELLKYTNQVEILTSFQSWTPPKFPLSGHVLMENNVPPGRSVSLVKKALQDIWLESGFKMSNEQLVAEIPHVLSDLNIKPKS